MVIIADNDGSAAGFRDGDGTLPSSLIFPLPLPTRSTSNFRLQTSDFRHVSQFFSGGKVN